MGALLNVQRAAEALESQMPDLESGSAGASAGVLAELSEELESAMRSAHNSGSSVEDIAAAAGMSRRKTQSLLDLPVDPLIPGKVGEKIRGWIENEKDKWRA